MPNVPPAATTSNIDPDRDALARYGLMVGDVQDVVAMALGAEPITTTVEGRERYTVSVRYPRDLPHRSTSDRERRPDPPAGRRHGAAWARSPR